MLISILTVPMKGGVTVTFIPHDELLRAGYVNLEDFMLIEANDRIYELQGFDHKAGLWWVEEVLPEEGLDPRQIVEGLREGSGESSGRDPERSPGE